MIISPFYYFSNTVSYIRLFSIFGNIWKVAEISLFAVYIERKGDYCMFKKIICSKCKTKMKANAKFCSECGTSLVLTVEDTKEKETFILEESTDQKITAQEKLEREESVLLLSQMHENDVFEFPDEPGISNELDIDISKTNEAFEFFCKQQDEIF